MELARPRTGVSGSGWPKPRAWPTPGPCRALVWPVSTRHHCARQHTVRAAAMLPSQQEAAPAPQQRAAVEQEMKRLERAAMDAHLEAQALNKSQKFDEAKEKYEEMRRLDAQALRLANSLGCPSCRPPTSAAAEVEEPAAGAVGPEYAVLQPVTPWPNAAAAERAHGAVLGCAVGDAAATGVQWIYDPEKLQAVLTEARQRDGPQRGLEFMDPPQSPFLPGYAVGRQSPYGEGMMALLRALAADGGLDCPSYAMHVAATFGDGFDGYRNASVTGFLRNFGRGASPPETGAEDAQADCVARLAPVVAAFAGHPDLMRLVAAATRTTQNTDDAESWACAGAAVLEALVVGGVSVEAAIGAAAAELAAGSDRLPLSDRNTAIAAHFQTVLSLCDTPHPEVVNRLGRNCHMPNAALTPLHAALHAEWRLSNGSATAAASDPAVVFTEAIRGALAGGGCCASRAGFAGACLGARLGPGAVPAEWTAKCNAAAEVERAFAAINAARGR